MSFPAFWFYLGRLSRVRAGLAGAILNLTSVFGVAGAGLILAAVLALMARPAEPAPLRQAERSGRGPPAGI